MFKADVIMLINNMRHKNKFSNISFLSYVINYEVPTLSKTSRLSLY